MAEPSPPRAVLLDWDNTLVDTWATIHQAMNETLSALGHAEWSFDDTKSRVRKSLREAFPPLFGERWREAQDLFYERFEAIHLDTLRPITGAEALLETLADKDIPTAIVSNKTGRFLRREVTHLGWDRFFVGLVGATDAPKDKPHPAVVEILVGENVDSSPESAKFRPDRRFRDCLDLSLALRRGYPI
jgi:phosphoglycolate phosphatase